MHNDKLLPCILRPPRKYTMVHQQKASIHRTSPGSVPGNLEANLDLATPLQGRESHDTRINTGWDLTTGLRYVFAFRWEARNSSSPSEKGSKIVS
jgi:hypothetical protein